MNASEATEAIVLILDDEEEQDVLSRINGLPDGPRRTTLLNAWAALNQAEARRHHSAERFGQKWPWR